MAQKMTKRMYFTELAELVESGNAENKDELLEFINHEIEMLDSKSSKKTPTKTQKENVEVKATIVNALAACDKPITITELMATNAEIGTKYSNQKLSALLKQLVDSGEVEKTIVKKRAYFAVVKAE